MDWKIKDYKGADSGGAVAGRFTLIIGPMQIRGWTHFCGNNGSQWVSGPQREYEKDGERKFYPFVYFLDKERWSKFQDWILEEIKKIAPEIHRQPSQVDDPDDIPF